MFANPVYLPQFSNREDLLVTLALFDDDTGDALDCSGCVRAAPGDFSSNLWLVTSGPYVSMSQSPLTIPDYPIGNEVEAVALTIAPNLPIMPGDPVTIANLPGGTEVIGPMGPPPNPYVVETGATPYITEDSLVLPPPSQAPPAGPNSMTGYVTSYAAATGALVCQIGLTFQFQIRPLTSGHDFDYAYTSSWDWSGSTSSDHPLITLALGSGVLMIDTGILQIRSPELVVRKLRHRTYGAYLTMTDSYDTRQIFISRLPTLYGGVSR